MIAHVLWTWAGKIVIWAIVLTALGASGWVLIGFGRLLEARLWRARRAVEEAAAEECQRCALTHPNAVRYVGVAVPEQREASR